MWREGFLTHMKHGTGARQRILRFRFIGKGFCKIILETPQLVSSNFWRSLLTQGRRFSAVFRQFLLSMALDFAVGGSQGATAIVAGPRQVFSSRHVVVCFPKPFPKIRVPLNTTHFFRFFKDSRLKVDFRHTLLCPFRKAQQMHIFVK